MNIQMVERLTMSQRFKLIVIAHETRDSDIKRAAVKLLQAEEMQIMMGPISPADHGGENG